MSPAPIMAISGSLRASSVNTAALRAAVGAGAAAGIAIDLSDAVRSLPHFDPDLEAAPPEPVVRFDRACVEAAGLLISVPEYAHGIPGAFKNALDWTVGSVALNRKPVAAAQRRPARTRRKRPPRARARLHSTRLRRHTPLGARQRHRSRR
jgi:chromate reductase